MLHAIASCALHRRNFSLFFSYSFELNPDWTESYSVQPEIQEYLERIANKYDLGKHAEFGKRVTKTTWNEQTSKWSIELDNGEVLSLQCQYLLRDRE